MTHTTDNTSTARDAGQRQQQHTPGPWAVDYSGPARQDLAERIAAIVFDGEFFQAEPLQYPFDAECFASRDAAEKWLRSEFDRLTNA